MESQAPTMWQDVWACLRTGFGGRFDTAHGRIRHWYGMRISLVVLAALMLAACSDEPQPAAKKAPEAPAAPITGRQAFQYVYGSARIWAPDAQPLTIRSINLAGVKSNAGKAGAWEAVFVSPSSSMGRTYTWSALEAEGIHKGVFPGTRQTWNPGG